MYKSKFNFLSEVILIMLVGIFAPILGFGLLARFIKEDQNIINLMIVGPLILFVLIYVWRKILTEMNQIEITNSMIIIRNLFTRRSNQIRKENLKGFKDIYKNGYTILLIDNEERIVAKINDYYYKEFSILRDNLGINYLGRVPILIDRMIKIEE